MYHIVIIYYVHSQLFHVCYELLLAWPTMTNTIRQHSPLNTPSKKKKQWTASEFSIPFYFIALQTREERQVRIWWTQPVFCWMPLIPET